MFLNYPNNPTGACASVEFMREASEFARENDLALCHDAAYIQTVLDGPPHPSLLASSGDLRNVIEFFSFSKSFNMAGWRVGFAAGDADLISALGAVKTNLDSGVFVPVQVAAAHAMSQCGDFTKSLNAVYRERRDLLVEALESAGLSPFRSRATFYVWTRVPDGASSVAFAESLLDEYGMLVAPGVAFGEHGEGFVRFSLTLPTERIEEASERLK